MFCTKCGKKLEEGQVCDCDQGVHTEPGESTKEAITPTDRETGEDRNEAADPNQKIQEAANKFAEEAKGLGNAVSLILKTPADGIGQFMAKGRHIQGLQLIGAKAVVLTAMMLLMLLNVDRMMMGLVKTPKLKPLLIVLLLTLILEYVSVWILDLVAVFVLKGKTTVNKMICAVGIKCLIESIFYVMAGIFAILSLKLGLIVLLTGSACGIVFLSKAFYAGVEMDQNKQMYALVISIGIMNILNILVFTLFSSSLFNGFAGMPGAFF